MMLELNVTSSEFLTCFGDITAWFNRRPSLGGEGRGPTWGLRTTRECNRALVYAFRSWSQAALHCLGQSYGTPTPLKHPDQCVEQTATGCPVVNPSPVPTEGTSLGCASHIGQSLLRTVEERIQIIKFILSPVWIGKAPCICWPLWRSP